MLLNASGYINSNHIAKALEVVTKYYSPLTLPICVDFDSVYDKLCPSRCVPRSNADNVVENTFYITKIKQAIINQDKLGRLPDKGSFYAVLPCLSLKTENSFNYSNNLLLEIFNIGEYKNYEILLTTIKAFLLSVGLSLNEFDCVLSDSEDCDIEIWVNYICVGTLSMFELPNGKIVTRGTVLSEPVFTQSLNKTT